ncbi:MAG: hypothetical protein ACM3S0_16580 [Acidobacteriota bacterium]
MTHPLYVAFVWHQHQPNYRDLSGGPACLPWVRLHAAKDYMHMAELVADFPAIHCTVNFVPSLVEQLAGIGEGRFTDEWQLLSLKEAWTPEEKQFLREHFFSIHSRLLERYPAYVHLRDRRDHPDLPDAYYLDLAAWFNLAWIDPRAIALDETLRGMVDKAQNFTSADVAAIIGKHRELAARVIPFHRELAARGQIELSVSPYYHPILPLLVDQRSAHEALPSIPLPATLFAHPEDAAEQIRRAVDAHRTFFGADPLGLWPPEGSVSEELLDGVGASFRWLASDEDILARSLGTAIGRDNEGNVTNPRVLYQPYTFARTGKPRTATALIFRDHVISDRIGFAYQSMSARDAAAEMVYRLNRIRERIADQEHGYLVSIILDGENAWESYDDNGDPFFRELYAAISNDSWLRTVTVDEYLRENPPREKLKRLAAGSWINGNFDTWIGEPAQNRAWELLAQTRDALGSWHRDFALSDDDVVARAWDELYVAEGSDWFWWYSRRNNSAQNAMFDDLFRGHLQNVYSIIGLPTPDELKAPILKAEEENGERGITALVTPRLAADAEVGAEWNGAGVAAPVTSTGTMQHAETRLARVYYGYNAGELFFRVESRVDLTGVRLALYLSTPHGLRYNTRPEYVETDSPLALSWEIAIEPGQTVAHVLRAEGQEIWREAAVAARVNVRERVTEIALSRADLKSEWGDAVGFLVACSQDHRALETLPADGLQTFQLDKL